MLNKPKNNDNRHTQHNYCTHDISANYRLNKNKNNFKNYGLFT